MCQQADLEARNVIPADLKAKLPASSAFSGAVSPTPDQLSAALTLIKPGWMTTVGVDIPIPAPKKKFPLYPSPAGLGPVWC